MSRMGLGLGLGLSGGGPVAPPPFSPLDLGDVSLWSTDLGVTLVSGKVSSWLDQGPNGYTAVQGTANSRPTFTASNASFNNKATINVTGSTLLTSTFTRANAASSTFVCCTCGSFNYVLYATGGTRDMALLNDDGPGAGPEIDSYTPNFSSFDFLAYGVQGWSSPLVFGAVVNGASSAVYKNNNTPVTGTVTAWGQTILGFGDIPTSPLGGANTIFKSVIILWRAATLTEVGNIITWMKNDGGI